MNFWSDGLVKITKSEGLKALWAGTGPSLLLVLNPAIVFMTYESLKRRFKGGTLTYFLLGAIAKCVATVITYPLQIVQTKMRVSLIVLNMITLIFKKSNKLNDQLFIMNNDVFISTDVEPKHLYLYSLKWSKRMDSFQFTKEWNQNWFKPWPRLLSCLFFMRK